MINGVFLVALCVSIFLEAIQRFVEPQVVSKPQLVLIVGCLGLVSNILGLLLFHDHSHGHGGGEEEHDHDHSDPISNAEEGHGHTHSHDHTQAPDDIERSAFADERGNIANVLPQTAVGVWQKPAHEEIAKEHMGREFTRSDEDDSTASAGVTITPTKSRRDSSSTPHTRHRRKTSASLGRGFGSVDNIHIHPASFRNEIIAASRLEQVNSESEEEEEGAVIDDVDGTPQVHERSGLLKHADGPNSSNKRARSSSKHSHKKKDHRHNSWHTEHKHSKPTEAGSGGHGHSHDLNMRGVFLHVMGDALGNIGVIASALFIWLTSWSWRYYLDPAISLVITCIILGSAIPLCKAASRILLQAVPTGMSVDDIREDIESLPSVLGCHHLHVWQLSDTKLVASLHIKVDCEIEGTGSGTYMHLARQVRTCLHEYGIHSSTIQPEFCLQDGETEHSPEGLDSSSTDRHDTHDHNDHHDHDHPNGHAAASSSKAASRSASGNISPNTASSKAASLNAESRGCLLDCGDECKGNNACCPKPAKKS